MISEDQLGSANENLAIKDRFVLAVFSGDKQTIAELLDPEFELQQPKGLAYAGTYKGAAGFMRFLEAFMATYDIESLENTNSYLAEAVPDVVVLEFRFRGRLKATGRRFDTTQFEPWQFRNGKILKIRPHWFEMPQLPFNYTLSSTRNRRQSTRISGVQQID